MTANAQVILIIINILSKILSNYRVC